MLLRPSSYKSTMLQMVGRGLRTVSPEEHPGLTKTDCIVLDFGTSTLMHGSLEQDVDLNGREPSSEAPTKNCRDCGAIVPLATIEYPAVRSYLEASHRLDDIYHYTRDRWSDGQAEKCLTGLFAAFDKIACHGVVSKPIPAEFGVEGFFFRYERHFVYWRHLSNGDIGIVTIFHERMHQIDRFREDFGRG